MPPTGRKKLRCWDRGFRLSHCPSSEDQPPIMLSVTGWELVLWQQSSCHESSRTCRNCRRQFSVCRLECSWHALVPQAPCHYPTTKAMVASTASWWLTHCPVLCPRSLDRAVPSLLVDFVLDLGWMPHELGIPNTRTGEDNGLLQHLRHHVGHR